MTDYLALVRDIVTQAAARGVEAEAIIMDSQETQIEYGTGAVEKLSQARSKGLGVRVIDGGRVGYAYTSDFTPANVAKTWQAAVELAAVASPDDYRRLPTPQPIPDDDLEIYDPDFEAVSTEAKIDLLRRIEAAVLAQDKRIEMARQVVYGDEITHVYLANSNGFAGQYDRTSTFSYVFAFAREGEHAVEGIGIGASNFFAELDPDSIAQEAAESALMALGGETVPTQTCPVVFAPFVTAMLLGTMAQAMTAEAMQKGRSFLIGKLGQDIASDKVSLMDNGRMKRGLASAPFDGEGVPTSATRLISEGVFENVLYDSYSAAKDHQISTGNAQRPSHRNVPRLGLSNFYLQPGVKTPEEIIGEVENGIYVTQIMQTGGIDPLTGECSMGAYGRWIENGELTKPVSGVTLATTLPDLLKNISEVGNNLRTIPIMGMILAPTIRVDNVMLGGKED
ncbi:MAG: TldD/PmbA family protein [Anaerolineae bacterium]|nr:TldD/PmbA family protein [Anaerolineae bacterium]